MDRHRFPVDRPHPDGSPNLLILVFGGHRARHNGNLGLPAC
jgi:hypothetical protein